MRSQSVGNRYLAGLSMFFAVLFNLVGTLGPARHSPYYWLVVPLPALLALGLGGYAWVSNDARSWRYSAMALGLLAIVLIFSHLLPRSAA